MKKYSTLKIWQETHAKLKKQLGKRTQVGKTLSLMEHVDDLSKLTIKEINEQTTKPSNLN